MTTQAVRPNVALAKRIFQMASQGIGASVTIEGEGAKLTINGSNSPQDPIIRIKIGTVGENLEIKMLDEEALAAKLEPLNRIRAFQPATKTPGSDSIAKAAFLALKAASSAPAAEADSKGAETTAEAGSEGAEAPDSTPPAPIPVATSPDQVIATMAAPSAVATTSPKPKQSAREKIAAKSAKKKNVTMIVFYVFTGGIGYLIAMIGNKVSSKRAAKRKAAREALQAEVHARHAPRPTRTVARRKQG